MDQQPDFLDNHSWFFIKLLVSATSPERTEEMDIKAYTDGVQAMMDDVGVACHHRAHIGHKIMPVALEMEEVQSDLIKNLGLWSRDVHEEHYAASMPLQAMRVAAGHKIERGTPFCKRQHKPRSPAGEQLRIRIFPYLDAEKNRVHQHNSNGPRVNSKPTAAGFLTLFDNLRDVLLRDMAIQMNDPNLPPHSVFRHPIFQSEDFALYRQEMAHHMVTFEEPNEQKLQMDHPGIAVRFDTLQNQLGNQQSMLNNQQSMLDNL